jgi:hypothetical protein
MGKRERDMCERGEKWREAEGAGQPQKQSSWNASSLSFSLSLSLTIKAIKRKEGRLPKS